MSIIQDKLNKLNPKHMTLLLLVVPVLLIAVFVWFIFLPFLKEKSDLEAAIRNTQSGISQSQVMERKIVELRGANAKLQQEFKVVAERLPSSEEDLVLQDRIKGLITESGLAIKTWSPGKKENDPTGLYSMTSINVEIAGSYHELGRLMEGIDRMTRMLSVTDLKMSEGKIEGKKMVIPVKFTLIAYSAAGGK